MTVIDSHWLRFRTPLMCPEREQKMSTAADARLFLQQKNTMSAESVLASLLATVGTG